MKNKLYMLLRQIVKFGAVGVIATLISYGIYILLNKLGLPYNISYTLGYLISFFFNYYASTRFTFNTNPSMKKGLKFGLSHGFNYLFQLFLLNLFISFGISNSLAPFFVYSISIPINFILVKLSLK